MLDKILNYRLLPAVIWLGLVLLAMLSPGDKFPSTPQIPHKDKIVHFGLFFVLNLLWMRVWVVEASKDKKFLKLFTSYLVFGIIFAILVEYLQLYVPNRSFDYYDIAANMLGAAVGVICFYILYKMDSKLV
ncbi:VanZ family protein [Belliella marina]|uniref:VanZ family protein n=1 Tax=Belliella marina TaxID=1644146 RepID=A0ABW4VVR5_9BACT